MSKPETKKRERSQKVGSANYESGKRKLMNRARTGLLLTMEALTRKLESKTPLRDEEIRFIKTFNSTLASLELKEVAEEEEDIGLPPGKLREFIEDTFRFREATGFTDTRGDGLLVMKEADYFLCDYCKEFHRILDPCPFKAVAEERKVRVLADKKEAVEDPNGPATASVKS
jgi:hypothetical protein